MKKAMIYGLGISGTGAKELLEKEGYKIIVVDDKKAMTSEEALNHLEGLEFFIKSPGIPYNNFVKEVQKRIRPYYLNLILNRKVSVPRKVQASLFLLSPKVYYFIIGLYKSRKKN